jgi:CelD/BcsL family acetyltransferase involved in cellulose biosynthesis
VSVIVEVGLDDPRWRDLVASHPAAVPFHHPGWAALLRDCYGFRSFAAITATGDGSASAGLPVMEVRSPSRRLRWVSLPFADYSPLLCDSAADRDALLEWLRARATEAGVASVEVRGPVGTAAASTQAGVVHELVLQPDPEVVLREAHRSTRRNVRLSQQRGVTVRRAESEDDVARTYYDLHLRTRRRLGVAAQSRTFFRLLWKHLVQPGLGFVLLAETGRKTVAGAVYLRWNGHLTYKFGASDASSWDLRPNHALMWEAIRWGCDNGYRVLNFGRSALKDTGLRTFKEGWGADEQPLTYATVMGPMRESNGFLVEAVLGSVLRRSPLWVCRGVGSALYRYAA